ncbi:Transposase IS66 family protein [Gemmobacter megaterium]|uniref:Transposase IS66 family protein n=1 Tax=Gemmobacter megaterium TaxID=1086013 RepID=A0A1N7QQ86_9RHOB|nr:transposase [Gemmobacter megaterium]GGE28708.1 hypothetical protein GCM10011345_38470 [Gemmobacter megaterium]SIT25075.1 Transposase IS66 family protein [Gemmobacter megaterium]
MHQRNPDVKEPTGVSARCRCPGYNRLTKPSRQRGAPVRVAHCWAHARRKLKVVFDRDRSEIAAEGLRHIAEFYVVEADIRGVSPG